MAARTWNIKGKSGEHSVRLEHSHWSGKATLTVDGAVIFQRPRMTHWAFRHEFFIDGIDCLLQVDVDGVGYRYELTSNSADGASKIDLIDFKCPYCGNAASFPGKWAGKLQECPSCYQLLVVPKLGMKVGSKLPIPIKTPRLLLRQLVPADSNDILDIVGDPGSFRYLPWDAQDIQQVEAWLQHGASTRLFDVEHNLTLAIDLAEAAKAIGTVTLGFRDADNQQMGFNIMIHRQYRNRGFGTEALRAAMQFAFEGLSIYRLSDRCDCRNLSAVRMFEKAGFRREGHYIKSRFQKGEWIDSYVYALLREEFTARVNV